MAGTDSEMGIGSGSLDGDRTAEGGAHRRGGAWSPEDAAAVAGVTTGGGAALPGVPRRDRVHGETPLDSPKPMVGFARRLASACDAGARGEVTGRRRDAVVLGASPMLLPGIEEGVREGDKGKTSQVEVVLVSRMH